MHVHYWGDALNLTGSVEKVLSSFAQMDEPDIELEIASLGTAPDTRFGNALYCHFTESAWLNRVCNKWLGLKAFTYPALIRLIEQHRPDVLHFHNRHNLLDRVIGRLSYQPLVCAHYHRHFKPYQIPARADVLVAVSRSVADDLAVVASGKPIEVIYNPVPVGLLANLAGTPPGERPAGKPRLLYAGGRQLHKGWGEFEAVVASTTVSDQFEISVCGPGLNGSDTHPAMTNLGMLDQPTFMRVLADADVVVIPSHMEGFPLMALESMALGKLVVATQAGGLGEIITARNALPFPVADQTALADALRRAGQLFEPGNEGARAMLLEAARTTVARFQPAEITRDLAALYRKYRRS